MVCRPTLNTLFLFLFVRSAGARGPGRGFRLPLPRPSGLPTLPNDQGLNPGPKRGSRVVQKPKKTRRPWLVKTLSAYKRRPGFFLTAFARRSDWYHRPASAGWWFSGSFGVVGRRLFYKNHAPGLHAAQDPGAFRFLSRIFPLSLLPAGSGPVPHGKRRPGGPGSFSARAWACPDSGPPPCSGAPSPG